MSRARVILLTLALLVLIPGLMYGVWWLALSRTAYLTDGDTISTPASADNVRDVLWRPAETLPPSVNTIGDEYEPALSVDGMRLCFVRGKPGEGADLYISERTTEGWSEPAALDAINTEASELGPEFSPSGNAIFFYSDRKGGFGGYDLWKSDFVDGVWLEPVNLGPVINSRFNEYGAALAPEDERLYFSSNRPRSEEEAALDGFDWEATVREDLRVSDYDIFSSEILDAGFSSPTRVAPLNSPYNEGAPSISPVGDFIYFASDRPGGAGGFDLYRSRRVGVEHWETESLGPPVNTAHNELDPTLGLEGFALLFSSDRASPTPDERVYDIYSTSSREVYRLVDRAEARLSLIDLWNALWPLLLWLLLTLLLLFLMLKLRKHRVYHKLSVLARCLLASLLIHALILMLLTFWQVSNSLGEYLRKPSGTRVALTTSARLSSITDQVRGLQFDAPVVEEAPELEMSDAPAQVAETTPRMRETAGLLRQAEAQPVERTISAELASLPEVSRPEVQAESVAEQNAEPVSTPDVQAPSAVVEMAQSRPRATDRDSAVEPAQPTLRRAMATRATDFDASEAPTRTAVERSLDERAFDQTNEQMPMSRPETQLSAAEPEAVRPSVELPASAAQTSAAEPRQESPEAASLSDVDRPDPSAIQMSQPSMAQIDVEQSERRTDLSTEQTFELPAVAVGRQPTLEPDIEETRRATPEVDVELAVSESAPASEMEQQLTFEEPLRSIAARPEARVAVSTPSSAASVPLDFEPTDPVRSPLGREFEVRERNPELRTPEPNNSVAPEVAVADFDLTLPVPSTSERLEQRSALAAETQIDAERPERPEARSNALRRRAEQFAVEFPTDDRDRPETLRRDRQFEMPQEALSLNTPDPIPMDVAPSIDLPELALDLPTDPAPIENPFRQRAEEQRAEIIERMGGSDETEAAVEAALDWLARHQSADGSWDSDGFGDNCSCTGPSSVDSDVAVTGLATLCFLGANHTHMKNGPHQERIDRAIEWLLSQQSANGDFRQGESMYSHGIATIAISEAYAMTGDARLRQNVQDAVDFIAGARNESVGGWRYDPGQVGDTSVLGWQVMALISAQRAGVEIPQDVLDVASDWLELVDDRRRTGLFSYQPGRPPTVSMTAEGMFVLQLLGVDRNDRRMRNAVNFIRRQPPRWSRGASTYYWYYGTLALFNYGGEDWDLWNESLKEAILSRQEQRGHDAGSWAPDDRWSNIGGRVYQTAICALSLEVYYRYLPLYARDDAEERRPASGGGNAQGD